MILSQRPVLNRELDSKTFKVFYYLKKELVEFCRHHSLPTSGGKIELSERIAHFLETGEIVIIKSATRVKTSIVNITDSTLIEANIICSEVHRAFFKSKIKGFSFNVAFQKWLKSSSGKTYREAIEAYHEIVEQKKDNKSTIDSQFEYNTYIRAFFADNQGRCLADAIKCWKYKKSQAGDHQYTKEDLAILEKS